MTDPVWLVLACGVAGFIIVYLVLPAKKPQLGQSAKADARKSREPPEADWRKETPERWQEVLGVTDSASSTEIRAAYRRLVAQYHPDRYASGPPEIAEYAATKMKEINAVYSEFQSRT